MEVLVFELEGSLAHFRKFYITSSALTYPFPPPTAVRGIIGAILGYDREEYLDKTRKLKIGLQILNPIKYITFSVNFINTKGSPGFEPSLKMGRTQTLMQLLKHPKYKVFVGGEGETFNSLKEHLENRKFVYTPCLGTSEHLAQIEYLGSIKAEEVENYKGNCSSIVPVEFFQEPDISSVKIGKERVPYDMSADRSNAKYMDVLYSRNPNQGIEGKFKKLWIVDGSGVFFLGSDG